MKKIEVKRSCGHIETVEISKWDDIDKAIQSFEKNKCKSCRTKAYYEKEKEKEKQAELEVEEFIKTNNLEPLKDIVNGTPKQNEFAKKIRYEILSDLQKTRTKSYCETLHNIILYRTNACFWINHRLSIDDIYLLNESLKELICCENESDKYVVMYNKNNTLSVEFGKDELFINIMKKCGFKWNGNVWYKKEIERGPLKDSEEVAVTKELLKNNFNVISTNEFIKKYI